MLSKALNCLEEGNKRKLPLSGEKFLSTFRFLMHRVETRIPILKTPV